MGHYDVFLPALFVVCYAMFVARGGTGDTTTDGAIHVAMFAGVGFAIYLYMDKIEGTSEKTDAGRKRFFDTLKKDVRWIAETDQVAFYPPSLAAGEPLKFVFMDKHPELVDMFKDLAFIQDWDPSGYREILVLTERFLQIYWRVLKNEDKTEMEMSVPILRDIKREILNVFHAFVYQVPLYFKQPKYKHLNPTDAFLAKHQKFLKAFLYKKLRILSRQWHGEHMPYSLRPNPPWPRNEHADNRYSVF